MLELRSFFLFQGLHDREFPYVQDGTNIFTRARLLLRTESFLCSVETASTDVKDIEVLAPKTGPISVPSSHLSPLHPPPALFLKLLGPYVGPSVSCSKGLLGLGKLQSFCFTQVSSLCAASLAQ